MRQIYGRYGRWDDFEGSIMKYMCGCVTATVGFRTVHPIRCGNPEHDEETARENAELAEKLTHIVKRHMSRQGTRRKLQRAARERKAVNQ